MGAAVTAARVLEVARAELGTAEVPPGTNRTKYGQAYGLDGQPWCCIWVWWIFREAGASDLIPKAAYTPTLANWFQRRSQWGTKPRRGALVFFDFPRDNLDRISHVGIVEAVQADGTIITIEANTTPPGGTGSQRDGGGVYRRARRAGIVGYGYPTYTPAAPGWPTIRRGSTGPAVELIQRFLGLLDDGEFGSVTEAAVVRYQRMRGLDPDGVVGPATWLATELRPPRPTA